MKGCRALTREEAHRLQKAFTGRYHTRNAAMLALGLACGFRVSELLSLTVNQVYEHGCITDYITVPRKHMKGKDKAEGRTVELDETAKPILQRWLDELSRTQDGLTPTRYVFESRVRGKDGQSRPITRQHAWKLMQQACTTCGISGKVGTHGWRKTFASEVFDATGFNLVDTQHALGHKALQSTIHYLSFRRDVVRQAIHTAAARLLVA